MSIATLITQRGARSVDRDELDQVIIPPPTETWFPLAHAQVRSVHAAVRRVMDRHPSIRVAVVTGLGAFLGTAAVRVSGLDVVPLSEALGDAGARCAPAVSVALLLDRLGVRS